MFNSQPKYPFIRRISALSMAVKLGTMGLLNPISDQVSFVQANDKPASTVENLWEQDDQEKLATLLLIGKEASEIILPGIKQDNLAPISVGNRINFTPESFGELVVTYLDDGENPIAADVATVIEQGCDYNYAVSDVAKAWQHELSFTGVANQQEASKKAADALAQDSKNVMCSSPTSNYEQNSTESSQNSSVDQSEESNQTQSHNTKDESIDEDDTEKKKSNNGNGRWNQGRGESKWFIPRSWWERDD